MYFTKKKLLMCILLVMIKVETFDTWGYIAFYAITF